MMIPSSQLASHEEASPAIGASSLQDLFALTDEQILEIEPQQELASSEESTQRPVSKAQTHIAQESSSATPSVIAAAADTGAARDEKGAQARRPAPLEPPEWLAQAMNDPQRGGPAREFWEGAQQARQEAAAYREVFAKPEEARAAAERARQLEDIDRAYFAGDTAERARLAAMMMREDPAAFREMVQAGLKVLQEATEAQSHRGKSVATAFGAAATALVQPQDAGLPAGPRQVPPGATQAMAPESAQLAAYATFEKAANEELEKSVGGAIERALEQALPNAGSDTDAELRPGATQRSGASVRERLSEAIRQDVEKALQGDRQLGEQVAQMLSARHFDEAARAQVVRLIGERAQQLVPGAAKRVLNEWTQTALVAHKARTHRAETASVRADLAPTEAGREISRLRPGPNRRDSAQNDSGRAVAPRVDYRKLSDEQILEM
jgi:hypothetical protein